MAVLSLCPPARVYTVNSMNTFILILFIMIIFPNSSEVPARCQVCTFHTLTHSLI